MVRCAIIGAAGRMGKRLVALAQDAPGVEVAAAVERAECDLLGSDAGDVAGVGSISVPIAADLPMALSGSDVGIAFVNDPAAGVEQVRAAADAGCAFVMGSTGMDAEQKSEFAAAAAGIAVVKASNFSVGITALLTLVERASASLGEAFDCEVIESHHTHKRDAPSGTAISLAEAAALARGWSLPDVARHGREGQVGERPKREIGMHALRAGDIVGHHTVLFGGTGETLELTHRAQSRDTFAAGALRAAEWVVGHEPGIYSMRDVLGL